MNLITEVIVAVGLFYVLAALFYGALRLLRFLPAMGAHWHHCACGVRWRHGNPWCAVGLAYPCSTCLPGRS